MRPYNRPAWSYSVMSVDQWVGVEALVPPHIQPESPDANLDYYYAMPELVRFRREELRGMIALDATSNHVKESPRTNRSGELPRSHGIAERLNELGRKARGSIASLMGRKDSLVKEAPVAQRTRKQSCLVGRSVPEHESTSAWSLESASDAAEHIEDTGEAEQEPCPALDTTFLFSNDPRHSSQQLTPLEVGKRVAAQLRKCKRSGELNNDVREAASKRRLVQTTEQEQWDASYEFARASEERKHQFDAAFEQGKAQATVAEEDVDLTSLPFEL